MYKLVYRIHALKRMRQRHIDEEDIHLVVAIGEVIENYPNSHPFPCRLVMGWCGSRCLHVVIAEDVQTQEIIVITDTSPIFLSGSRI